MRLKWRRTATGAMLGFVMLQPPELLALNEDTTIILHAQPYPSVISCNGPYPFDCATNLPTTSVVPGASVLVYIFLKNYEQVNGLFGQLTLQEGAGGGYWGDWTLVGTQFYCAATFQPPGQEQGTFSASFSDCVEGGALKPIGFVWFIVGTQGCLAITDAGKTGVSSCAGGGTTLIRDGNLGRVCVSEGGYNACDPIIVPVESMTWGRIKEQYAQ